MNFSLGVPCIFLQKAKSTIQSQNVSLSRQTLFLIPFSLALMLHWQQRMQSKPAAKKFAATLLRALWNITNEHLSETARLFLDDLRTSTTWTKQRTHSKSYLQHKCILSSRVIWTLTSTLVFVHVLSTWMYCSIRAISHYILSSCFDVYFLQLLGFCWSQKSLLLRRKFMASRTPGMGFTCGVGMHASCAHLSSIIFCV